MVRDEADGAQPCYYCGVDVVGEVFHDECADEYERRVDAERCVYCNCRAAFTDLFGPNGEIMICRRCDADRARRVYRGYPGDKRRGQR